VQVMVISFSWTKKMQPSSCSDVGVVEWSVVVDLGGVRIEGRQMAGH
jgi:hypothetical protein